MRDSSNCQCKKSITHSLRFKLSCTLFFFSLVMVLTIIASNRILLDKYYLYSREKGFVTMYDLVNEQISAYEAGSIDSNTFAKNLDEITVRTNIGILVVNNDWTTVYASMQNVNGFMERLQESLFRRLMAQESKDFTLEEDGMEAIAVTRDYTIYKIYNETMKDTYLELVGRSGQDKIIYMSLAVRSLKDSVAFSNSFILYVGLIVSIFSIFVAFILATWIAHPIRELSILSQKMTNLDFTVKYCNDDRGEIGELGNSMNEMSHRLERTISELKSANAELKKDIETKEAAEQMRQEFLSNVSHELKTPIALIQGYAEGLKDNIADDPESTEFYCDVIMDEAGKMNSLVKKLLTLNQLEFGNDPLTVEHFDIVEVVRQRVDANQILASSKNVTITMIEPEPIYVWADEFKIEEVVTNFLTNAINYCMDPYQVKVSFAMMPGDVVRVSIFNTGATIDEEELDNIWEKFYKVDKARTREVGGSGIGLSIVKAIMEQHHQKCGVINHEDGVEFFFELDAKKD